MAKLQIQEAPRLADRLAALDKEVRAWAKMTRGDLIRQLNTLGLHARIRLANELPLRKSIKARVRKKSGEIESVGFSFARHGIFLERGVGKYRPAGSAEAARAYKPWLKPVIEPSIEDLADLLEQEYADIAAAEFKIVVPGIINTTIKANG